MNYGEIVSQAWKIFLKQKALWLFYFVTILPVLVYSYVSAMIDPAGALSTSGFWVVGSTLIVALISLVLTAFAQVGIIRGIYLSSQDSQRVLTFREIYDEVLSRYKRMLGLFLLAYLAILLMVGVIVLLMIPGMAIGGGQDASPTGLMLFCYCLLIPVMFVVGVVFQQAAIALCVDDLSIGESVNRGWKVFRTNFGQFLILGLILLGISIGFGIIVGIPTYCVIGFMVSDMLASGVTNPSLMSGQLPWYYYPASIFSSLAGGLFSIFVMAIFVLVYLELTRPSDVEEQLQIIDSEQEPL